MPVGGTVHAHSQFENRSRRKASQGLPLVRCFTGHNHVPVVCDRSTEPSYPEGNFRGNQLLGGSIGLSPLCRTQATQFARQNSDRPPPQFPMASSWNGIVHHLSGPRDPARTQNPVHRTSGPAARAETGGPGGVGTDRGGRPLPHTPRPAQSSRRPFAAPSGPLLLTAVAFTTPCGLVDRTSQPAGSIDSLIRVSRRAAGGPDRPKPCLWGFGAPQVIPACAPRQPGGGRPPGGHHPDWCSHPGPPPGPRGTVRRGVHRPARGRTGGRFRPSGGGPGLWKACPCAPLSGQLSHLLQSIPGAPHARVGESGFPLGPDRSAWPGQVLGVGSLLPAAAVGSGFCCCWVCLLGQGEDRAGGWGATPNHTRRPACFRRRKTGLVPLPFDRHAGSTGAMALGRRQRGAQEETGWPGWPASVEDGRTGLPGLLCSAGTDRSAGPPRLGPFLCSALPLPAAGSVPRVPGLATTALGVCRGPPASPRALSCACHTRKPTQPNDQQQQPTAKQRTPRTRPLSPTLGEGGAGSGSRRILDHHFRDRRLFRIVQLGSHSSVSTNNTSISRLSSAPRQAPGPAGQGCHRGAAATAILPVRGGLSGRPRAGPGPLGTGSGGAGGTSSSPGIHDGRGQHHSSRQADGRTPGPASLRRGRRGRRRAEPPLVGPAWLGPAGRGVGGMACLGQDPAGGAHPAGPGPLWPTLERDAWAAGCGRARAGGGRTRTHPAPGRESPPAHWAQPAGRAPGAVFATAADLILLLPASGSLGPSFPDAPRVKSHIHTFLAPFPSTAPTPRCGTVQRRGQRTSVFAQSLLLAPRRARRHPPLPPPGLQGLLTLFAKSFASFNHSTCALSVSCRMFCLARDTPGASNCSPKPLYSGIRAARPGRPPRTGRRTGQFPSAVGHSRALPGATAARPTGRPLRVVCPQHRLEPTEAERTAAWRACGWGRSRFGLSRIACVASSLAVTAAIAVARCSSTE